jgi:hypothetical protein
MISMRTSRGVQGGLAVLKGIVLQHSAHGIEKFHAVHSARKWSLLPVAVSR